MPTDTHSPKYRLLDHLVAAKTGMTLRQYVELQRAGRLPWRKVAANLSDLTGEDVSITTINDWFSEVAE